MKKILIITDALTRPLYNVRTKFLCDTLIKQGVEVTWITEKYQEIPFNINCNFIQIPFYKRSGITRKIEWLIKSTLSVLFDYKNNYFTRKILSITKQEKYDIVFCSTFHTFGLKSAYTVAKNKNIPLHIDLRDIAEQCNANIYSTKLAQHNIIGNLYRKINIIRRNNILKKADSISSVSEWHVNFLKQINTNSILIYNGFDKELFRFSPHKTDFFDIVYTGRWYGHIMQDPTLIFSALQEIISNKLIPSNILRIVWYTSTDIHKALLEYAKKFNLQNNIIVHKYVDRALIPNILLDSSICLVLSSNDTQGIMTTKVYEALGCEKPILCTNCSNGELYNLIMNTHSGLATTSKNETINFITSQYSVWQKSHYTHAESNNTEFYSRQYQTSLLIEHLKSLCTK